MSEQFFQGLSPYKFNGARAESRPYSASGTPIEIEPLLAQLQAMGLDGQQIRQIYESLQLLQQSAQQPPRSSQPRNNVQPRHNVELAIIEVGAEDGPGGRPDAHAREVFHVARREGGSNNPTRMIRFGDGGEMSRRKGVVLPEQVRTPGELNAAIDFHGSNTLTLASARLEELAAGQQGNERLVVNMSLGYSRAVIYSKVLNSLSENRTLQRQITGGLTEADGDAYKQRVVNYVDQRLDKGGVHQRALRDFRQSVAEAADQGIVTVVAAGNDEKMLRKTLGPNVRPAPGAALNFLAQSDEVIAVAAHDRQGRIADFSSTGNHQFTPDIAALGVDVSVGNNTRESGTSFASPAVAGTITEMLEANPNLSVAQIEAILKGSASDTRASRQAEGGGLLNSDQAIALARKSAGSAVPRGSQRFEAANGAAEPAWPLMAGSVTGHVKAALASYAKARIGMQPA